MRFEESATVILLSALSGLTFRKAQETQGKSPLEEVWALALQVGVLMDRHEAG